ncbi:hypothetical protein ONE63_002117 [Megalurothrips usitatus]|uniref:Uncharacterized protein n=1 Tax=Megalurothrips usitatus TaxID=439358 RepID=A0AAV7XAE2_9NEOP|nr:hypothetical protein ONE63_002117 [Megalurothrips usitatus]
MQSPRHNHADNYGPGRVQCSPSAGPGGDLLGSLELVLQVGDEAAGVIVGLLRPQVLRLVLQVGAEAAAAVVGLPRPYEYRSLELVLQVGAEPADVAGSRACRGRHEIRSRKPTSSSLSAGASTTAGESTPLTLPRDDLDPPWSLLNTSLVF